MKNLIKICLVLVISFICSINVFAWCGPGWGPPPPPPPHHPGWGPGWGGWGYPGDCGLANAAAITSIVASGVSIMSNLSTPRVQYVQPVVQPVYTQPVVQPVYTQPVVPAIQPVVRPVYYY